MTTDNPVPAGVDVAATLPPTKGRPSVRDLVDDVQQTLEQAANRRAPLNPHDVEERMRPALWEVYEAESDARATASHPTRLERAYRAALDQLLDLNGVHR